MGFKIVSNYPPLEKWYHVGVPAGSPDTVYVGQLVQLISADVGGGVVPYSISGTPDVTRVPFGIVTATNNRNPVYSSTYNAEYISSLETAALVAARSDFAFQEGMLSKGDRAPMVKVALLDHSAIIEGPIRTGTINTAPGVVTVTTAGTALGATWVHSSADVTAVAENTTYHFRTGANAGLYRVSHTASQTTGTFRIALNAGIAIGDTACVVNVAVGRTYLTVDAEAMWVENGNHTAEILVDVIGMDLRTAGQETVLFRFITV
jgi:hypothetical protein